MVAARQSRREEREATGEAAEPLTGKQLLSKAAARAEDESVKLGDEEMQSAIDYFLKTEEQAEEEPEVEPTTLKLNLGTKKKPEWVRWVIVPVEDTLITKFRRESQVGTRAQKRRGDAEVDEARVALKVVRAGTIDPDPKELARTMDTGPDPLDAIRAFFKRKKKTGEITQISGEILSISGWDDEDVQEVEAARG